MNKFHIVKLADPAYGTANIFNHNKEDFNNHHNHNVATITSNNNKKNNDAIYLKLEGTVYKSLPEKIPPGTIGISLVHRKKYSLRVYNDKKTFNDYTIVTPYKIDQNKRIKNVSIKIDIMKIRTNDTIINIHKDLFNDHIKRELRWHYFYNKQILLTQYIIDEVEYVIIMYIKTKNNDIEGFMTDTTEIELLTDNPYINIISASFLSRDLFRDDFDFSELGIGGLNKELRDVFKRALATRALKKDIIDKLGIKHVKGMILYGPPGTGKTLIARNISHLLSNIEPKIVNGPEVLNKYVGESEKNIRELFSAAEDDQSNNKPGLHVIIFDEIDAICKSRGTTGTQSGVNDSIVNMLLSKIDGIHSLNNIFIIGMTNRKELLDSALLRAGRFELHIRVGIPDLDGRKQIFKIHTNKMTENSMVSKNINYDKLSDLTQNFSGAEIEAVVKGAVSSALHSLLSADKKEDIEATDIVVEMKNFEEAVKEIKPGFGNSIDIINRILEENSNNNYDDNNNIKSFLLLNKFIIDRRGLKTALIYGKSKSGKTYLLTKLAKESKINCIKIIRSRDLLGKDEYQKEKILCDPFIGSHSVYESADSFVIVDDIELIINYVEFGSSIIFSNKCYQSLMAILKTSPLNKNNNLVIMISCHNLTLFEQLSPYFDLTIQL